MEPLMLLHRLEIERREHPAHRRLVEARRARAEARRARIGAFLRGSGPGRLPAASPRPCGC
jgi:hypothetical protein